jgi:hypothetical protein
MTARIRRTARTARATRIDARGRGTGRRSPVRAHTTATLVGDSGLADARSRTPARAPHVLRTPSPESPRTTFSSDRPAARHSARSCGPLPSDYAPNRRQTNTSVPMGSDGLRFDDAGSANRCLLAPACGVGTGPRPFRWGGRRHHRPSRAASIPSDVPALRGHFVVSGCPQLAAGAALRAASRRELRQRRYDATGVGARHQSTAPEDRADGPPRSRLCTRRP